MLQTINASAEDRTGQVIVNTVTGLATIAATAATGGVPLPTPSPTPLPGEPALGGPGAPPTPVVPPAVEVPILCKDDIKSKIRAQTTLDGRTSSAANALSAGTLRLQALTGAAQILGGKLDGGAQAKLIAAEQAVAAATAAQTAAAAAAAKNQADLTDTVTFRIPQTGDLDGDGAVTAVIPSPKDTGKWTKTPLSDGFFTVAVRMEPLPGASISKPEEIRHPSGIAYRVPVRGRMIVCNTGFGARTELTKAIPSCSTKWGSATTMPSSSDALWEASVPQFESLLYVPYSNGVFENNLVSVAFNSAGNLVSAEYQAKSSAEAASQALMQSAAAAQTGTQAVARAGLARTNLKVQEQTARNNFVAAINASELAQTNQQIAQAAANATLVTDQAELTTAEQIGLLQANTALSSAQLKQIQAQVALTNAQASSSSGTTSQ